MNVGWGSPKPAGGVLGESFPSTDGGNPAGETGGINECLVELPKGSLGITFDGWPATVEAIDDDSPFKSHGVYVGMLVDTVTVHDSIYNSKKVHYELDTDQLIDVIQKHQTSRVKGKCLIRFVAPHYVVTPPPVPTCLDPDLAEAYDNVSLLNMKDGDQGSFDGDSDSDGSVQRVTAHYIAKGKSQTVEYKLDAPTEETTDDEVEADELLLKQLTFESDDNSDNAIYGIPYSEKDSIVESEYADDSVYETPSTTQKKANIIEKYKSKLDKTKSKNRVSAFATNNKPISKSRTTGYARPKPTSSGGVYEMPKSSSKNRSPTAFATNNKPISKSRTTGYARPKPTSSDDVYEMPKSSSKNRSSRPPVPDTPKTVVRTLTANGIVKTTTVKKTASRNKSPKERIAKPLPEMETKHGLWA